MITLRTMFTSRKNSYPKEIRDIRFPTSHAPEEPPANEPPVRQIRAMPAFRRRQPQSRRRWAARWIAIFLVLTVFTVLIGGVFWYRRQIEQIYFLQKTFLPDDLPALDLDAPASLAAWLDLIKEIFSNLGGVRDFPFSAISALDSSSGILRDIPTKFLAKDGPGVIEDLSSLRDNLALLSDFLSTTSSQEDAISILSGFSEFVDYKMDLDRARVAIERVLALLQSPGRHHVLILFGNSAELRPGGGFLGSFADVSFGDSNIYDITVHDINEVDRGLDADIVPPKPIQGIATRWRAADANWFFDYPASARKTLEIMSRSSFYASSTLDGAILISPRVIQDILAVVGPVEFSDGNTVASDNIIPLIQREVQAGQASGAENPKEILAQLLDPLESKLKALENEEFEKIIGYAGTWIQDRDVVLFMSDPEFSKVLAYYRADGKSYAIPQSFSGDYLAAVNANLGGGKSDARIEDIIEFESDLRADGVIENMVKVIRESSANSSDEWWYRVTNQDYLQVFTPIDAVLTGASGGTARVIAPRTDYSRGFEQDPEVTALESTSNPIPGFSSISQLRQSGKNVFATWLTTPAGGSGTLSLAYRRDLKTPFSDGDDYTFIFERQSGAHQSLHLVLNAPPGFVWQYNGTSKFEYLSEHVSGRTVIDLVLEAI